MANINATNAANNMAQAGKLESMAAKKPTNASTAASITAKANAAQESAIHNLFVDTNNDGKISTAERNAHANDLLAHKDQIDRDKDGKISFQEELKWALDNGDTNAAELSRFLATDTNKDGALSAAEKMAYIARSIKATADSIKKG